MVLRYKVIIDPSAQADVQEIFDYLSEEFENPPLAEKVTDMVKKKIYSLNLFPKGSRLYQKSPAVYLTHAKNYNIFFSISDKTHAVHILHITHSRRRVSL